MVTEEINELMTEYTTKRTKEWRKEFMCEWVNK